MASRVVINWGPGSQQDCSRHWVEMLNEIDRLEARVFELGCELRAAELAESSTRSHAAHLEQELEQEQDTIRFMLGE